METNEEMVARLLPGALKKVLSEPEMQDMIWARVEDMVGKNHV